MDEQTERDKWFQQAKQIVKEKHYSDIEHKDLNIHNGLMIIKASERMLTKIGIKEANSITHDNYKSFLTYFARQLVRFADVIFLKLPNNTYILLKHRFE